MGKESSRFGSDPPNLAEIIVPENLTASQSGFHFDPGVETLARSFYEHIEHLDPGCEPYVEWADLKDSTQDIYRFCIEHIFKVEPQAAAGLVTRNDLFGNAKP